MKLRLSLFVIMQAFLSTIVLCQESLPAQVDRLHRDLDTTDFPNYPVADLAEVSSRADVVVVGRIMASMTHLNATQPGLETDYQLKVSQVLKPATLPDQKGMLTVRRAGGQMAIHGHKVTHSVAHTPMFDVEHDYVLFLRFNPANGTYNLSHGPFGMYEIKGERIHVVEYFGNYNRKYDGMDFAKFSDLVREAVAQKDNQALPSK